MPASVCEPVSAALRASLAGGASGAEGAEGRLRGALLAEVEFEPAGSYHASLDSLKSKYVVLRPHAHPQHPHAGKLRAAENSKNGESGLPSAKRVLFPLEQVLLGWSRGGRSWSVGSGMQNVGNTCYLNSTLQALFHVPAFANWLMSDTTHAEDCRHAEGCVICGMRATLVATQKGGGAPIKPWQVYSKLRLICRHLTPGRQEDAHEFLRYLVEAMEKSFLARCPGADKLEQYSKETTPLNQIQGGYLRSTVRCLACGHLSTTYQHFEDLLLDIRKHSTLDEALDSFFSRERLEDLGYKCEACNKKVSATKQFFIERAPMVLCIALKRFSLAGGKLSKHIQFRKKIILNKYTHHKQNAVPLSYRLVSMVTHLGPSQNCGHYTAIGQAPNGNYYQFDDSCVRPLPLSAVLGTNAYIMFYEKENPSEETIVSNSNTASTSNVVYGPQLPDNREKSPLKLNLYKNEERKPFSLVNTESKIEKPPIILNSTLSNEPNCSKAEPWVVKQNGDIEKVKINGSFNENSKNYITKGSKLIHSETNGNKNGSVSNGTHKLEKKVELPLKIDKKPENGEVKKNSLNTKLVPYDSESESGDERRDVQMGDRPSRTEGLVVTTKVTHCVWTVSNESSRPLLSPSLNGVVNNKIRENHATNQPEENGKSPNTSTSSMSSPEEYTAQQPPPHSSNNNQQHTSNEQHSNGRAGEMLGRHDTLNKLQHMSHRGYGAPVNTWAGTQASMGRQVYEERRDERKRALEGADEMDAGRNKRVKKFNRFNNNHDHRGYNAPFPHPYRNNGYNPFQEKQNRQQWGGGGGGGGFNKYRGDRRPPPHHFHNKRFNRYGNNNHHYRRH